MPLPHPQAVTAPHPSVTPGKTTEGPSGGEKPVGDPMSLPSPPSPWRGWKPPPAPLDAVIPGVSQTPSLTRTHIGSGCPAGGGDVPAALAVGLRVACRSFRV